MELDCQLQKKCPGCFRYDNVEERGEKKPRLGSWLTVGRDGRGMWVGYELLRALWSFRIPLCQYGCGAISRVDNAEDMTCCVHGGVSRRDSLNLELNS